MSRGEQEARGRVERHSRQASYFSSTPKLDMVHQFSRITASYLRARDLARTTKSAKDVSEARKIASELKSFARSAVRHGVPREHLRNTITLERSLHGASGGADFHARRDRQSAAVAAAKAGGRPPAEPKPTQRGRRGGQFYTSKTGRKIYV